MKEIALVMLITDSGEDVVLDAYTDFDEANQVVVDLIYKTGDPSYYVQYVRLY